MELEWDRLRDRQTRSVREWVKKSFIKWVSEWVSECSWERSRDMHIEFVRNWMTGWMIYLVSELVIGWVSDWLSESVSHSVSQSVSLYMHELASKEHSLLFIHQTFSRSTSQYAYFFPSLTGCAFCTLVTLSVSMYVSMHISMDISGTVQHEFIE